MYTILTTCPPYGSRNVGDLLIEASLKEILAEEKGEEDFLVVFREESLDRHLSRINCGRAILMPGCGLRSLDLYPGAYRLVRNLKDLRVPLIPVGANWNVYPGDRKTREAVEFSSETRAFLKYLSGQFPVFSCREHHACRLVGKHGVPNPVMTGDPAMFHLGSLGKPFKAPERVGRFVFSPPLSPYYGPQAVETMQMLASLFPGAERFCAFHLADPATTRDRRAENSAAMTPEVGAKNRLIREAAGELSFQTRELAGDLEAMGRLYDSCDLHVGYECHAHLYFLALRKPSILLAEDARGVGFLYTMGGGGFNAFSRRAGSKGRFFKKSHTSGYCTTPEEWAVAGAREDLVGELEDFLREELETGFRRYEGFGPWIDRTYAEDMRPFIRSLP